MSQGKHLTKGQKQAIIEFNEQGMSAKDMAYRMGVSLPTIYKHLKSQTTPKIEDTPVINEKEQQVLDQIRASKYYDNPTTHTSSKEYVTSDLFLTCALLMWGHTLLYVTRSEGDKFTNFYFEKNEKLSLIVSKYFDNILTSQMNVFVSCYKQLKYVVFGEATPTVQMILQACKLYINMYSPN